MKDTALIRAPNNKDSSGWVAAIDFTTPYLAQANSPKPMIRAVMTVPIIAYNRIVTMFKKKSFWKNLNGKEKEPFSYYIQLRI